MKKLVLLVIILLNLLIRVDATDTNNNSVNLRGYDEIQLPEGTFIPVMITTNISTQTCPEGYKLMFIVTDDLFMYETNVVPKGTEIYGYIEKINEPIIGTNASIKIKVTKMIMPDKYEIPINGYLYSTNNNLIGGELTPPTQWEKVPHYQSKFQGISWNHRAATLQLRPGRARCMGEHTTIITGDRKLVVLTAPLSMTHIMYSN